MPSSSQGTSSFDAFSFLQPSNEDKELNESFGCSTAFQPLYGQLADVFGRRWPLISAVSFFALGSGISGGAKSTAMLIGGRAVQGVGLGGVNMLIDIVGGRQSSMESMSPYIDSCLGYMRSSPPARARPIHGFDIRRIRRRVLHWPVCRGCLDTTRYLAMVILHQSTYCGRRLDSDVAIFAGEISEGDYIGTEIEAD